MYQIFDVTLDADLALTELVEVGVPVNVCTLNLTVRRGTSMLLNELKFVHHWRNSGGHVDLSLAIVEQGYFVRFPALVDFLISTDGCLIEYFMDTPLPENTLRHILLDQMIPRILGQQGALVLHASCVRIDRVGAVLFVGESGAGKSTLAASLQTQGAELISDDCILVKFSPEPLVVPSYSGSRLFEDSMAALQAQGGELVNHYTAKFRPTQLTSPVLQTPQPLAAICLLDVHGHRENTVTRSRSAADLMTLISQTFQLDVTDKSSVRRQFENLQKLTAAEKPLFKIGYSHDLEQLPGLTAAVMRTLQQQAGN